MPPVHDGRTAHRPVVVAQPLVAEELQLEPGDGLRQLGVCVLHGRTLGTGLSGGELLAQAFRREAGRFGGHPEPHEFVVLPRRAQLGSRAPLLGDDPDHAGLAGRRAAADGHPLVHERGLRDPPAFADRAEALRVRDADLGQEDLVELGLTGDLAQRPDLDARRGHVAQEVRHALVLGHVRVGAGDEDRPARLVRHRGPDLLAVDDPVVTVFHGPGR